MIVENLISCYVIRCRPLQQATRVQPLRLVQCRAVFHVHRRQNYKERVRLIQ
jgi:hypothetical protein